MNLFMWIRLGSLGTMIDRYADRDCNSQPARLNSTVILGMPRVMWSIGLDWTRGPGIYGALSLSAGRARWQLRSNGINLGDEHFQESGVAVGTIAVVLPATLRERHLTARDSFQDT